jgi:hypothetical protein
MSKISMLIMSFAIATLTFWAFVLTNPPTSQAATGVSSERAELAAADHCVTFGICP